MLAQYQELKQRLPEEVLLLRPGDLNEMVEGDAELASRDLKFVLTSRLFSRAQNPDGPLIVDQYEWHEDDLSHWVEPVPGIRSRHHLVRAAGEQGRLCGRGTT